MSAARLNRRRSKAGSPAVIVRDVSSFLSTLVIVCCFVFRPMGVAGAGATSPPSWTLFIIGLLPILIVVREFLLAFLPPPSVERPMESTMGNLRSRPFIACPFCSCKSQRNLPPSPACFLPRSRSNRAQKISSQPCDGSIKAEHGTLSMISSIAPAARL